MNKFHKVSYDQYRNDRGVEDCFEEYGDIKLPKRATSFSAGYDFFAPIDISLEPGDSVKIPTGIRVELDNDKFLACVPRSGLGFKFRLMLNNTIGIIDSDYFGADNEGHIQCKLFNGGDKVVTIRKGDAYMQGIILPYFTIEDDNAEGERHGGFGSTG